MTAFRYILATVLTVEASIVVMAASLQYNAWLIVMLSFLMAAITFLWHDIATNRLLRLTERACLSIVGFGHIAVPLASAGIGLWQLGPIILGFCILGVVHHSLNHTPQPEPDATFYHEPDLSS